MPVAALAVGEVGVHRRVVQENDFFARVAFVVFVDSFNERARHTRAIALGDVADALIGGCFQGVQAFSGAELVVKTDHFKFNASRVNFVVFLSKELEAFELVVAHRCHQARQGVNPCDFDGFAFLSKSTESTHCQGGNSNRTNCKFHI